MFWGVVKAHHKPAKGSLLGFGWWVVGVLWFGWFGWYRTATSFIDDWAFVDKSWG